MPKQHITPNIKILVVKSYLSNKHTQKELAELFEISERTIRRWTSLYNDNDNL